MSFNVELKVGRDERSLTGIPAYFIPPQPIVTGNFTISHFGELQIFVEMVSAAAIPAFGRRIDQRTIDKLLEQGRQAEAEAKARQVTG